MRERDLITAAFNAAKHRDNRDRLIATTADTIKEARKLSSQELGPDQVHEHIERWERGWKILEEGQQQHYNVYIKAHNY